MTLEQAHAKVNLVLRVGPPRADGLHPIASLLGSLELADTVSVEPADRDELLCPGVERDNLAERALLAVREAAGGRPGPVRIEIEKRVPVAAGLGGGSADAAAVLRAANDLAGGALSPGELSALAAGIGSDVPGLLDSAHAIIGGAGEAVERVDLPELPLLLVPAPAGLLTRDVYAEFDRLGTYREDLTSAGLRELADSTPAQLADALENDLQPAALSLRPELERTLAELLEAGALGAAISGSGPTAFGIFPTHEAAATAAAAIPDSIPTRTRQAAT